MDYTLALYKSETFERLAYSECMKKLVKMGYPDEILSWSFDPKYTIRGLVIDKKRGNVLKIDRHRYVKIAYHGFARLSIQERKSIYDVDKIFNYEEPDFALIDTLFSLAEVYLFCQLVEYKDSHPESIQKSYEEISNDVRHFIDLSHRDGSLKSLVAKNPEAFIKRDPSFFKTFEHLRQSEKKLFLATNSLWSYTHVIMNYLFFGKTQRLSTNWLDYFDLIITGACKPSFFTDKNPLYEVDIKSGLLKNTDGIIDKKFKVYQGGYFKDLHSILNISYGHEVLFVGDHIYGDILRSKKILGWRTMIVVPELDKEIKTLESQKVVFIKNKEMRDKKEEHESLLEDLKRSLKKIKNPTEQLLGKRDKLKIEIEKMSLALSQHTSSYHEAFHPTWGATMKTGNQNSRFAKQVEDYACIYTSEFTNIRYYSLEKYFHAQNELMPHESD